MPSAAQIFQAAHRITRNMRAFLWTSTPYREVFAKALRRAHQEIRAAAAAAASLVSWAAQFATEELPSRIQSAYGRVMYFSGTTDRDAYASAERDWNALKTEAARRGIA